MKKTRYANLTNGATILITIRNFEMKDEDYQHAVDIGNAVWVDYPETVNELREDDEKRQKAVKWGRYFAEVNGETVGYAYYSQSLWLNHPGKLWVGVLVLPDYRNRGVGTALWQRICRDIEQYDPLRLLTSTREDYEDGVRFALKLDFIERMRDWESRLDPLSVNPADWEGYSRRVAEQGIEIKTVVELKPDPNRDRKLYEMEWLIDRDVPSVEPPAKMPFEEFQKVWERTNLIADAWFVALDNGEYVGMSNLWGSQGDPNLVYVGLTGVIRSHRKRGIAMALKLKTVDYARQKGIGEIRTWNESHNKAMLDINNGLGFVRQPSHIDYAKEIREQRPEDAELTIVPRTETEAAA